MNASEPPFAFFGTPYVARDTLAALIESGFVPSVVVTSPDAPRGRGLSLTPSETRTLADSVGIPTLTPSKLDGAFTEDLRSYDCEYAIVVAYGKLLPQRLIDSFPRGVLNIHYSLLPKYRGASPVEAALLSGDTETGVTIQRMALKMDAGDILAKRTLPINEDDTTGTLRPKLVRTGAELLIETLPAFLMGTVAPTVQDEREATFSGKITKEQGRLSLENDPDVNWRKYRAYQESPGTYFFARKDEERIRVKIRTASYKKGAFVIERIIPESRSEQDYEMFIRNGWEAE